MHDQPFMAIGDRCTSAVPDWIGIFVNGSSGGTDVGGAIVNKYKNISIGRLVILRFSSLSALLLPRQCG